MVTRVGFKLRDAFAAGMISRETAIEHVREGLDELHGLGLAHCDVVVDNVFVHGGIAYLDDLEYLTPIGEPAPATSRWDQTKHPGLTAILLDEMLYASFILDIHRG
jgi:hypothetical protein